MGSVKPNRFGRSNPIDDSCRDQEHQRPEHKTDQIQNNDRSPAKLNGHCREVIGFGIQADKARVLLKEAESDTDDVADEHAQQQDPDGTAQEHLADKTVARSHGLQ